ncbi:response regulator [Paenibacillus kobensis]|uniref:response regulator n=1 Tax=Paenibacillus kobensis TaxID=59841 RepID=UPI000FDB2339|nr:response regulator [Paenibacillus kobensis]
MHILIVDDEPMVRSSIARVVTALGEPYAAYEADDGEDAIAMIQKEPIDLVITDIRMPAVDGLQLAEIVRRLYPHIRVVLLSGYSEFEYALSALHSGVYEYLLKPASKDSLLNLIFKVHEELQQEKAQDLLGRLRENSVMEKRVQELLYGLPVPHADKDLFPDFHSLAVFVIRAETTELPPRSLRFAMKNVIEELLGKAGKAAVIVEDSHLVGVLFASADLGTNGYCDEVSGEISKVLAQLYRVATTIRYSAGSGGLDELGLLYVEGMRRLSGMDAYSTEADVQTEREEWHRLVKITLKWIEEEYAGELTLASAAQRLFVNPNYLSVLIKSQTDMTFTQHLVRVRIGNAKQMLAETQLKIYEICEKVGYADQAYFSRLFKASTGMTPYEYREKVTL